MSLFELIIELIADLIAVVLGVVLIIRTKDNKPRLYWGVISIIIGLFFSSENINWVITNLNNPKYKYDDILNIEKMLKWFAPATFVSLFPVASLRPGYLNRKRVIVYLLPFMSVSAITITYLMSNPELTEVHSVNQILQHSGDFNIRLRVLTFLISIIIPLTYFLYPLLSRKTYRKISLNMYLFLGFNFLLLFLYVFFTLSINTFFFNAFGIASILFAITMSFLYLRSENPLSIHLGKVENEFLDNPKINPVFYEIEKYLKEFSPFKNYNYDLNQLADELKVNDNTIIQAIKSAGFTGFREYINFLRLEHFKLLASQKSQKTVKELMFECGFSSRTTFYRLFSEHYGISPIKFIENCKNSETMNL